MSMTQGDTEYDSPVPQPVTVSYKYIDTTAPNASRPHVQFDEAAPPQILVGPIGMPYYAIVSAQVIFGYHVLGPTDDSDPVTGQFSDWKRYITILYEPNTMTVTLDPNDAPNDPPLPITTIPATFNQQYGNLPAPYRVGYRFNGWTKNQNGTGGTIISASVVAEPGDHTLYGWWTDRCQIRRMLTGYCC